MLMDYKLASEYRDVAMRPEHLAASSRSLAEVALLIDTLEALAEPVLVVSKSRPLSPDPDDDMVIDLAINGYADAIITQNMKHFSAATERFGIPVLLPADFLQLLRNRG